jgi:hypothetical protein
MGNRTALLINCSKKEAQKIREIAGRQRRTISGYILNLVMNAIRLDEGLARLRALGVEERLPVRDIEFYGLEGVSSRPVGPRTTMLLSCTIEEAQRIRETAKKKEITISGLVLHALRLAWMVSDRQVLAPASGAIERQARPKSRLGYRKSRTRP